MVRRVHCLLLLGWLLVVGCDVNGFDFGSTRAIGLGQAVVLSEPTAASYVSLPSAGFHLDRWQVELGINRKFEISDLDEATLAGACRYDRFVFSGGFSQLGERDFYSERLLKLGAAYFDKRNISLGMTFSTLFYGFGWGYDGFSLSTFGMSVSYFRDRIYGSLAADNLTTPKYGSSPEVKPQYHLYTELLGQGSYSVIGRATFEDSQQPQFTLGQKINLLDEALLLWALSSNPLTYGGGLELSHEGYRLSYTTSYHPTLGFTHGLALSYAPRQTTPEGDRSGSKARTQLSAN